MADMKKSQDEELNKDGGCCGSWRETLVVAGSFMAAYTAYLAIQSLQSSLNQEAGLGVVSLACLYGTIIISGLLTPSFLRLVGHKKALVIAWVCHTIYVGCNFYPTWATLIPASVLLGAIAGPMWTAESIYITTSGERIAARTGEKIHTVLSRLNGVFFMCYECTQISGNLISSLVLQQGSYDSANSTAVCGVDDCPGDANATAIAKPETRIVYILMGTFAAFDVVALLMTIFLLPPLKKSPADSIEEDPGLLKTLLSWFTALSDPKLICLVPFFVSSSISQGIIFTDFTKSYISCAIGVSMVGFIMASHGAVTSIVATITSRAAEFTGRYVLFGISIVCNMAMLLTLLFWKPDPDNNTLYFVIPAIWGIAVGIFHTQFNTLVGLMFPDKKAAAFANYHTWNSIGYTITFAYSGFLCVRTKLYVAIVLFGVGSVGYVIAEIIHKREKPAMKSSYAVSTDTVMTSVDDYKK